MTLIFPVIFLALVLFGAYITITPTKVWQRAVGFAVCNLIAALLFWIIIAPLMRYSYAANYRSTVIYPTRELWGITATNLARGNIDQAIRDIGYIHDKWFEIGTDSSKYTGKDLLKEIKEQQQGEQSVPGYPPQGVGSPEP